MTENTHDKRSIRTKRIIALLGVAVLLCVTFWLLISVTFRGSAAYEQTLLKLERSATFKEIVGHPFEPGFVTGLLTTTGPSGEADLSFEVTGPNGQAKVFSMADRRLGIWKIECIRVVYDQGGREELIGDCSGR